MAYPQQSAWGGGYTSPLSTPPSQYGGSAPSQSFAQQNYQPFTQPTASQQQQQATARTNPTTAAAQPPQQQQPASGANYYQSTPQYSQVKNWYQQFLGRAPSDAEVQQQLHGYTPEGMGWQNLSAVQYNIQNSPEAQAYAQRPPAATVQGAPSGAPAYNTASWDTNGYAAPGYIAPQYSNYAMPGWDQTKWNNAALQDPKYVVGRILQSFPPTPDGLQQAMALIAQAYPGTQLSGKDTLLVPGLAEPVDVLKGASAGGQAWQWLTPSEVARNAAAGQPAQADPTLQALQMLAQQMQVPQMPTAQQPAAADNSAMQAQIAQLIQMFQQQQQDQAAQLRAASLAARTPNISYY
jgi:hypothetical protein